MVFHIRQDTILEVKSFLHSILAHFAEYILVLDNYNTLKDLSVLHQWNLHLNL